MSRPRLRSLSWGALLLVAHVARADVATEARFLDGLARRSFDHGDYGKALDAFLQVQSIAPSAGALYNVAVCAELAKQPGLAFASYRDYLTLSDPDSERRRDAEQRLAALQKNLAVVTVTSQPKGAAIYVDRKELGTYGPAPRSIVIGPGERSIVVELEGFEDAATSVHAVVGATSTVDVRLVPKMGELTVDVVPETATLEFELRGEKVTVERTPAGYRLPVGAYRIVASAPGHVPTEARAVVREGEPAHVTIAVAPQPRPTGKLLVGSGDVTGEVYLDGRRIAETPATLPGIAPGSHDIEVRGPSGPPFKTRVALAEGQTLYVEAPLARQKSPPKLAGAKE